MGRLHVVRNRIAHHEALLDVDLRARVADVLDVAARLHPELAGYVGATTRVPGLLARRPG